MNVCSFAYFCRLFVEDLTIIMAIPFDDILCSWNLIINCTVMALLIIVTLMREDIVIEYK